MTRVLICDGEAEGSEGGEEMWWQKQGQRHRKMVPLALKVEEGL